jgi:hypothetical protein
MKGLSMGNPFLTIPLVAYAAITCASAIQIQTGLPHPGIARDQNTPSSMEYMLYRNEGFGYSFEYPKDWKLSEAFDGGGVSIAPVQGPYLPKIGVSGSIVQAREEGKPLTLDQDFESMMLAVRKKRPSHERENVALTRKESTSIQGLPVIAYTITYKRDGFDWIDEGLLIHDRHDEVSYGLGFSCHPGELALFRAVLDNVVRTFRILKPRK